MNSLQSRNNNNLQIVITLLLAILAGILSPALFATDAITIDLGLLEDGQTTGDSYIYLTDSSQTLTLQDVLWSKQWNTPQAGITNRGPGKDVTWMRFSLHNPEQETREIILEYVDPAAEQIDLYSFTSGEDSNIVTQNFTYKQAVDTRPVAFYRPAFQLSIGPEKQVEVLIRILPGNDFLMHSFSSFRIWHTPAFDQYTHKELSLLIILLCAEIFMGLATIILFLILRQKIFLYYAFFAFTAASLFAAFSGLWQYFIAQNHYELWMVVFQISLCQVASILFVRKFLQTKIHMPNIDLLLLAALGLEVLGMILNVFGQPYLSRVIIDFTAIGYFILIPVGLIAHRKGVPHALLFTASWIVFIVGMAMASARLRGYIPDSFTSQWLIYIGGFVEISLLATIMILSVRRLEQEKRLAESRYRQGLLQAADELSVKVEEQTRLLEVAKEKAEAEARIDLLTGLSNRRAFMEAIKQFMARANRNNVKKLYLGIIDLDHFKNINDTYGHSAGDAVLRKMGRVFKETVREVDVVSRIGGEEFAVIMESANPTGVIELCERLRHTVEHTVTVFDKQEIKVTISMGLAQYEPGNKIDKLMRKADKTLYLAKLQGRNQVLLHGQS
ncbi:MAG: sensor domain-containing diguanylate cyclase [Gammaproteobacteria bacterium]|nr:sensor domain-containing diguanylate cyclase [Gammaproteobacteria bacterium]